MIEICISPVVFNLTGRLWGACIPSLSVPSLGVLLC